MSGIKVGFVLSPFETREGRVPSWDELRSAALIAEQAAFDMVWIPDELVWDSDEGGEPRGWWECATMCGALAEATSTVGIGTWVLSALHRNPGVLAKMVETLDEVSGGRFVFGFGAGHAARQGEAFGFPLDKTVGRYVDALDIVVPLLRTGFVDFEGEYHSARRQVLRPRGPRSGKVPLMLGGHGPRTMRLAVQYADIWSAYTTNSSSPEGFSSRFKLLDELCESEGRDSDTLKRSIGLVVTLDPDDENPGTCTVDEVVQNLDAFADMGCDRLELWVPNDPPIASVEALATVAENAAAL
ncbi:MAG: LLM class flavin-dependent oxidoreductase [Acidobacteria bacterium]|nr:MAG: LLM class flavin-dependent oxidoreductase [Acidobacteriota bacterium]